MLGSLSLNESGRKALFVFLGIVDIAFFFLLFDWQQYFSLTAMLALLLIFVCGAAFLFLAAFTPGDETDRKRHGRLFISLTLVSALAIIYELLFFLQYSTGVFAALPAYVSIALVATIPTGTMYLLNDLLKNEKGRVAALKAFAALLVASIITSYVIIIALQDVVWIGTDEIGFDYYASTLIANHTNPYTHGMMPIITQLGLDPTLRLNSSCECQYGYPALSFLPFALLPALGVSGYYPSAFIFVTVLCATLAAFIAYRSSERVPQLLPLLFFFIVLAFAVTPAGDMKYLAVSVFLLLAYVERKSALLSGALIGLAASTHQLAWVAIPFIYVLILNSSGRRALLSCVVVSLAVFLAVNSYFLLISPQAALGNMLFFGGKLTPYGTSLMQALLAFLPVPYSYSAFLLLAFYLASLVLFYFYGNTLKVLPALTPALIFFFSWVNDLVYFLAFVPLLLLILYSGNADIADRLKDKKPIKYACALLAAVFLVSLVFAHLEYTSANTLVVNTVYFNLNTSGKAHSLHSLQVNVTNNGNKPEDLLFHIISRDPNKARYIVQVPPFEIGARSTDNFTCDFSLSRVGGGTQVYVYVMSNDYIQGSEFVIP